MSTTTSVAPRVGLIAEARLIVANGKRSERHSASEKVPNVDGIMATVTPPDQLSWMGGYAWSLVPGPDGLNVRARTTIDEVREFYEWRTSLDVPGDSRAPLTTIRTSWYNFSEAFPTIMHDVDTGEVTRVIDSLLLITGDGSEGITSEIVWLRLADIDLAASVRSDQWNAYVDAFRAQDAVALSLLVEPNVQSAVREYVDPVEHFVAIHSRDEFRAHFERFFARFEVVALDVLQTRIGTWFVFHELLLSLRVREGVEAGLEYACRIGEYLPYSQAGLFQGRCGYGTELIPS